MSIVALPKDEIGPLTLYNIRPFISVRQISEREAANYFDNILLATYNIVLTIEYVSPSCLSKHFCMMCSR